MSADDNVTLTEAERTQGTHACQFTATALVFSQGDVERIVADRIEEVQTERVEWAHIVVERLTAERDDLRAQRDVLRRKFAWYAEDHPCDDELCQDRLRELLGGAS